MNKSLNVLVLAQYFPPDMGGASTRASNVVKGLLKKECKVTVVAAFPHYPKGEVPKHYKHKVITSETIWGAKVFRMWIPALPHSSALNRIILHLCFCVSSLFALPFVGKVDVVWGANPNLFSFFPGLVYGAVKRVPLVRNVDDLWPEVFYELGYVRSKIAKKILDFLAWLSYVVPAAVTPISEGYKRCIVSKYGVSSEKVHVVEVGVDNIKPIKSSAKSDGRFIVMYSGVLGLGYDFDVVFDAAQLLSGYEDVVFVIRGVGEKAAELKEAIGERGLVNVVLDTRFLPKSELDALLDSADAFVLPMADMSFVEQGLPTKVFEYQSYGKPVLCVSGGEPARYVESTNSGLIVKPNDASGFAEAIIRLYKDEGFGVELGQNGKKHVSNHLTSQKIGERMYEIFCFDEGSRYLRTSFPSKRQLTDLLGSDDYFVWEYYGIGLGWIFRSRVKVILSFLRQLQPKPRLMLDVGCGPMFISSTLVSSSSSEYVGIDVLPVKRLKKYKDIMKKLGVKQIAVVRASAESLPLRKNVFDFVLSLDVLEHLPKSKRAIMEIRRVTKNESTVAISLPLENSLQKLSRIGFKLVKPKPFSNNESDSIQERIIVPITRTPDYHYGGDVDSYGSMYEILKDNFELQYTKYAPLGFVITININALHILKKRIRSTAY